MGNGKTGGTGGTRGWRQETAEARAIRRAERRQANRERLVRETAEAEALATEIEARIARELADEPETLTPESAGSLERYVALCCATLAVTDTLTDAQRLGGWRHQRLWALLQVRTDLGEQYALARAEQAHRQAERALQLAEEARHADPERVQGYRLAVETRKWLAGKIAPKIYGERVAVDEDRNVTVRVVRDDARPVFQSPEVEGEVVVPQEDAKQPPRLGTRMGTTRKQSASEA